MDNQSKINVQHLGKELRNQINKVAEEMRKERHTENITEDDVQDYYDDFVKEFSEDYPLIADDMQVFKAYANFKYVVSQLNMYKQMLELDNISESDKNTVEKIIEQLNKIFNHYYDAYDELLETRFESYGYNEKEQHGGTKSNRIQPEELVIPNEYMSPNRRAAVEYNLQRWNQNRERESLWRETNNTTDIPVAKEISDEDLPIAQKVIMATVRPRFIERFKNHARGKARKFKRTLKKIVGSGKRKNRRRKKRHTRKGKNRYKKKHKIATKKRRK